MSCRAIGAKRNGLPEMLDGAVHATEREQAETDAVMEVRVAGVGGKRLLEFHDGSVVIADPGECFGQQPAGSMVTRVEIERLPKLKRSIGRAAGRLKGQTEIVLQHRDVGINPLRREV